MLIAFILIWLWRYQKSKDAAIIETVVIWNLWSFGTVEVLSQVSRLNKWGIRFSWGALCLVVLAVLVKGKFPWRKLFEIRTVQNRLTVHSDEVWALLLGIVVLALALVTVPYNWDSMSYHLSRIAQWAGNESVAHYAANDVRQLSSPVLAEFINVQVYILCGFHDYLLNMLQACSYLLNAWLVYQIAKKLGCGRKFSLLAMALFMTMPTAFGEALSTQVDEFASVWFLIFVYYFIDLYEIERLEFNSETAKKCIILALCISMGYMAKPSVDIGMAVLLCFLLIRRLQKRDAGRGLAELFLLAVPFVALPIIPELLRNYMTFHAFSDPVTGQRQLIGTWRPNYVVVNLLKNIVHNLPSIYLYDSTEWMAKALYLFAKLLRVNLDDISIAEDGTAYIMNQVPVYGHDTATNPVIVSLAIVCTIYAVRHLKRKAGSVGNYTIYIVIAFLIFCTVVRWEPFVSRYMLSYLAALCPMIGWWLQDMAEHLKRPSLRQAVAPVIIFICMVETLGLLRFHQEIWREEASVRPDGYFYNNKEYKTDTIELTQWITEQGWKEVGFYISPNALQYPLWTLLQQAGVSARYVGVENASARYEDLNHAMDCVIVSSGMAGDTLKLHGAEYQRVEQFEDNTVLQMYLKKE